MFDSKKAHARNLDETATSRTVLVFSIFDTKAKVFSPPHIFTAKGIAIRTFSDMANDEKTSIGKHPEDFSLAQIGVFNESTGEITPSFPPEFIAHGHEFVGAGTFSE